MVQITCKNLSLGYEGKTVTQNINFSVNRGDYLCIVGENGSGKSTLIKAILLLIKPLGGEIIESTSLKNSKIGYLPQQTEIQKDFPASVKEVVLSGCSASKRSLFYNGAAKKTAKSAMERMGILDISDKSFRDLSGGQRQRVFLARALCATDEMLVLDEPVTGLDPGVTEEMYNLLMQLNNEDKTTIIMVSHDISAAIKYASHILHIAGTQLFFGRTCDYLKSEPCQKFLNMNRICSNDSDNGGNENE